MDEVPIHWNVEKKCKRVLQRRRKAAQQEELYESQDKPAFEVWKHQKFSRELNKIDNFFREQSALENRISTLFFSAKGSGATLADSYAKMMGWKVEKPKEAQVDSRPGPELPRMWMGAEVTASATIVRQEARTKDGMKKIQAIHLRNSMLFFFRFLNNRRSRGYTLNADDTEKEWKNVYRSFVLRLQADHANSGERREELWHQVQDAYWSRDLSNLLHIKDTLERKVHVNELHFWRNRDLLEVTRRQEYDLQEMLAPLRSARRILPWGFSQLSTADRQVVRWMMPRELSGLQPKLEDNLNALQDKTARWKTKYRARVATPPPVMYLRSFRHKKKNPFRMILGKCRFSEYSAVVRCIFRDSTAHAR